MAAVSIAFWGLLQSGCNNEILLLGGFENNTRSHPLACEVLECRRPSP